MTTSTDFTTPAPCSRSLGASRSSTGVIGRTVLGNDIDNDDAAELPPPDAELTDDDRGFELICSSTDAALSSSAQAADATLQHDDSLSVDMLREEP